MNKKEENKSEGTRKVPTNILPWFNRKFSKKKLKASQDFRNDRRSKDDRVL